MDDKTPTTVPTEAPNSGNDTRQKLSQSFSESLPSLPVLLEPRFSPLMNHSTALPSRSGFSPLFSTAPMPAPYMPLPPLLLPVSESPVRQSDRQALLSPLHGRLSSDGAVGANVNANMFSGAAVCHPEERMIQRKDETKSHPWWTQSYDSGSAPIQFHSDGQPGLHRDPVLSQATAGSGLVRKERDDQCRPRQSSANSVVFHLEDASSKPKTKHLHQTKSSSGNAWTFHLHQGPVIHKSVSPKVSPVTSDQGPDIHISRSSKLRQFSGCVNCGATQSPAWRRGPDGCTSLCNSCGLQYAKRGHLVSKPIGKGKHR